MSFSEGFHPKPRMTFPLALAVGIEALDEVMELELTESLSGDEVFGRLAPHVPPGMTICSVDMLPTGTKKAKVCCTTYQIPVPPAHHAGLPEQIQNLLAASTWPVIRSRGQKKVDPRPAIQSLVFCDGVLSMRLRTDQPGAGPRDVLAALNLADLENEGVHLVRTNVELAV